MTSTPQSLNTTWSLQFNFSFAQVGIFDLLFFVEFNDPFAAIIDFANLVKKLISKICYHYLVGKNAIVKASKFWCGVQTMRCVMNWKIEDIT